MPEEKVSTATYKCAHCGVPRYIHEYPNATFNHGFLSKTMCDTQPPAAQPCPHVNTMGHEWESHCVDCGEVWKHSPPDYSVTTTDPPVPQEAAPRCPHGHHPAVCTSCRVLTVRPEHFDTEQAGHFKTTTGPMIRATAPDSAMRVAEEHGPRLLAKYGIACGPSIQKHADKLIYGNEFLEALKEFAALIREAGSERLEQSQKFAAQLESNIKFLNERVEAGSERERELRKGLYNLRCEIAGWLGMARPMLVQELSLTNVRVMEDRIAETDRLLGGESK